MNYLLPVQTILDLLSEQETPAQKWAGSIGMEFMRVSVISLGQAYAEINQLTDANLRAKVRGNLDALLADMRADSGVDPLNFTKEHALVWTATYKNPTVSGTPQTARQIYATAASEGLTVAEEDQGPRMRAWTALGVKIETF